MLVLPKGTIVNEPHHAQWPIKGGSEPYVKREVVKCYLWNPNCVWAHLSSHPCIEPSPKRRLYLYSLCWDPLSQHKPTTHCIRSLLDTHFSLALGLSMQHYVITQSSIRNQVPSICTFRVPTHRKYVWACTCKQPTEHAHVKTHPHTDTYTWQWIVIN